MTPVACACSKCAAMCANSTCLPTPEEARALIRAGFGERLATYKFHPESDALSFVGPAPMGFEGARELADTRRGCTFFDGAHCQLHALGLKPLEGRLAHHDRDWRPIRIGMAAHWRGRQFASVLKMLERVEVTA